MSRPCEVVCLLVGVVVVTVLAAAALVAGFLVQLGLTAGWLR